MLNTLLKNKWQKIILICAILLAAGVLVYAFFGNYFPGSSYWQQKKMMSDLERPYRTDTYGGKTPEETFNMFLTALKSGDVELASKYLGPEDKERWLKWFNERTQEEQNQYIKELSDVPSKWKKTEEKYNDPKYPDAATVYFSYSVYKKSFTTNLPDGVGGTITKTFPAGEYHSSISLYFNIYTKVWKISEI
jgi:hypothetical protein